MNRRTIAVCVTGYNWECEGRIISGMYSRCQELDINLMIFASQIRRPDLNANRVLSEEVIKGESEIYNLINYDMVDGVALLGESLIDQNLIYKISERAKQHNIPVVNINDAAHLIERNVVLSDRQGMELAVRHLIEDHGLTKINFIGGFEGNFQTEERLTIYKNLLAEHNIPVEESRIGYGQFWKAAYDCTQKFLDSGDIPQAIVCASDTMACFCMDCLKENGYRIPEDIIVTGFDGIRDSELYTPSITTVRPAYVSAGKAAVDLLSDIWNGKETSEIVYVNSELIINRSCGCKPEVNSKNKHEYYEKTYANVNRTKEFNMYIFQMSTRYANVQSTEELYANASRGAEFFNLDKVYICICEDIERNNADLTADKISLSFKGLSDNMISMLKFGHDVPVGTVFPTSQLVPENLAERDTPFVMAFSPIYFKNSFLGYLAYEPKTFCGCGDFFATWLVTISNNAGSFYMKNELEYVVKKLREINVRDPLTGLYNRRGLDKYSAKVVNAAKKSGETVTVICADIDNLKPINDIYGHEAGDNAIVHTAKALREAMPEQSVCTRTGGDEFSVILKNTSDEETAQAIKKVNELLDEYNESSGLPYAIGCSCGFRSGKLSDDFSLEDLAKLADAEMYRVKIIRKANRR